MDADADMDMISGQVTRLARWTRRELEDAAQAIGKDGTGSARRRKTPTATRRMLSPVAIERGCRGGGYGGAFR